MPPSSAVDTGAAILSGTRLAIVVLAPDGRIQLLNPSAEALWGLPAVALQGQLPAQVVPAVLPPTLVEAMQPGSAAKAPVEYWLPHTRQRIRMHAEPAADGSTFVYWSPAAEPSPQALLHRTEEVAHTGSYEGNLRTGAFTFSEGLFRLFGEAPNAFVPTLDFIDARSHPADVPVVRQVLEQALVSKRPYTYRRRIYRPDGTLRMLEAHGVVECNAAGEAVKLLGLVQDVTERVQAEADAQQLRDVLARQLTDKYRALFTAMDEGFCLIEVLFDADQQPVDYRFVEVNPAFEQHTGLHNVEGRTVRELGLELEQHWFEVYGRVALTGEPITLEQRAEPLNRWFAAHAFRVGLAAESLVAVLFNDVTARRQAEIALQHAATANAFRVQLADALGPLIDPVHIQEAVTHTARLHFAADRCYYCEIEDDKAIIRRDASVAGLPSVAGTYPLDQFGLLKAGIAAGRPFAVTDVHTASDVDEGLRQLCIQLQVISYLNVPVIKHGQAVGLLCLVQSTPRTWTAHETNLAVEVAERTWTAVQRARTEDALRQSEAQFRLFVTASSDIIYKMSPDWQRMFAPDGQEVPTHTAEVRATWLEQYVPPEEQPRVRAAIERAIAGQSTFELEHRMYRADGSVGWTYSRAIPVLDAQGTIVEWFGTATDITARRQADEALRVSEEQFRTVANLVPDLLWRSDAAGHTNWHNRRWLDYTGQSATRAASRRWNNAVHPFDWRRVAPLYEAAQREGRSLLLEQRLRNARGQYRWFEVQVLPVCDAAGEVQYWYGAATDIHQRKLAMEATAASNAQLERAVATRTRELKESKALQEAVFRAVPHAIMVFVSIRDEQHRIVDFRIILSNGVAERHLGLPIEGETLRTLTPGYFDEENFLRMVQTVETGQPAEATQHMAQAARFRYLRTQYHKLRDGVVLVLENVTARHQAELALQQSRDLLQSTFDTTLLAISVLEAVRDEAGVIQDFRIMLVNRELARETGRNDLVGKLYKQEYPGIVAVGLFDLIVRVVETGEPQQLEYFYPHEGFNKWFSCVFVKRGDGVVGTNLDISQRKQAEEEQRKTLVLLKQAETMAQLGSWEFDVDRQTLRWSPGLYRLFDLPLDSPVRPETYLDYVVPEDRPVMQAWVAALRAGQVPRAGSIRLLINGTVRTLLVQATTLPADGDGARVLGVDMDVTEVRRLEAENVRMRLEQQRTLFGAVLEAQEAERRRISEALHNGLGQLLFAVKLRLDQLPVRELPAAAIATHSAAIDLLTTAIRQARALSHELVPTMLSEFGLAVALHDICRQLNGPALHFQCAIEADEKLLPQSLQLVLYRIAQELAQNIVKHAQATEASLALETVPGFVLLRAEDNGVGFPTAPQELGGLGLRSIQDHVALLGGTLDMGSTAHAGTYVRIRIPLAAP